MHANSAVSCILLEVYRTLADKSDEYYNILNAAKYAEPDPLLTNMIVPIL